MLTSPGRACRDPCGVFRPPNWRLIENQVLRAVDEFTGGVEVPRVGGRFDQHMHQHRAQVGKGQAGLLPPGLGAGRGRVECGGLDQRVRGRGGRALASIFHEGRVRGLSAPVASRLV